MHLDVAQLLGDHLRRLAAAEVACSCKMGAMRCHSRRHKATDGREESRGRTALAPSSCSQQAVVTIDELCSWRSALAVRA